MTLLDPASPRNVEEPRASFYCPECEQTTFPAYPHKCDGAWHIPASGGGFYELLLSAAGSWSCTCPGYHYRGYCRHILGNDKSMGVYDLEAAEAKKRAKKRAAKVTLESLFE